jgi:tetratricopeptide (TPR) repeat protein
LGYHNLDEFAQAEDKYLAACTLYEQIGDLSNVASALNNLADLELGRDNPPAAVRYLERAQQIAAGREDSYLQALIDYTFGVAWVVLGDLPNASRVTEEGLALATTKQYIVLQSGFWGLMGQISILRGDAKNAMTSFDKSMDLLVTNNIQSKFEWSVLYSKYGEFLCGQENTRERGCEFLGRALALTREMGPTKRTQDLERLVQKNCVM